MNPGWQCEGLGEREGRAVKGFGRGQLIQIFVLHGLPVDGGMEGVDSQLGQGTELGFLGPEPGRGTLGAFLGEKLSTQGWEFEKHLPHKVKEFCRQGLAGRQENQRGVIPISEKDQVLL